MRHASAPAHLLRQVLVVLSGMAVAGLVSVGPAAPPAAAQTAASVTVNATSGLGTIPADAIGLNTAVYDGYMNDTPIPGLLKAAGIDALRYPGGSYSDIYNWQNGTAAAGGYVAPNTGFSSFMTTAKAAGAQPIITVNYGTGTPSLAAAWVSSALSNGDGVKYWEVGNEVYGNGTYGANWEADAHCDTSPSGGPVTIGSEPSQTYNCGPGTYAAGVVQYMTAMHAADPNAKVCAVGRHLVAERPAGHRQRRELERHDPGKRRIGHHRVQRHRHRPVSGTYGALRRWNRLREQLS